MVKSYGQAITGATPQGHRPIPRTTDLLYRKPHDPLPVKPTGFDWDWNKTACTGCGTKTAKPQLVNGVCPSCRGVKPAAPTTVTADDHGSTYAPLPAEDLEERFTAPSRPTPQTPAASASPRVPAPRATPPSPASPGLGGKRPAADAEGEAARQPATTTTQETTVTSPPFPTYIVDIAIVMRDSENHYDPAVRAARKAVANALVGLNRELTRVGSPAAPLPTLAEQAAAAKAPSKPRGSRLDADKARLIRDYSTV